MTEETIFHAALERPDRSDRAAFLDSACAGDADLRRRVEALLRAHDASGHFLESSPGLAGAGAAPTLQATGAGPAPPGVEPTRAGRIDPDTTPGPESPRTGPPAEGPGTRIGPYTLAERIGEGGMGVVYRAEQAHPVRRTVALKVIRAGMDTEQVVARFEAERQALALMEHPNIARVLDAGATPAGRPFFVMELVKGAPITAYCDDARLTPRQRLELFLPVCQAIQHAHQKGVIHRDIKPSNVLVAEVDGRPVPKVIDFGVAKATDRRLTERGLFTRHGAVVGTPEYMSPEQASPEGQDVDTRSDVYSLGVLLYELLTGATPIDRQALPRAALDEVLRRVREDEPTKPSSRLSSPDGRRASVAAVRGTDPSRLARLVRGDLDWVVMKALDKDRTRRYEAVVGFARDVQRFLDGDPVEAGPPSRAYRLRKFARKHRAGLSTAAAFALLLVAATAVSTREARRATRAEGLAVRRLAEVKRAIAATSAALSDTRRAQATTAEALTRSEEARKQAEAVSNFLVTAFRSPDPRRDGRQVKVVDVLDLAVETLETTFDGSPRTRGDLLHVLGKTYRGLGLNDRAVKTLTKARAAREAVLGPDHPDTLAARNDLALSYLDAGQTADGVGLLEATLKAKAPALGPGHPEALPIRHNLAMAYQKAGRTADAIAVFEATLKAKEAMDGPGHPDALLIRHNLATAYLAAGRTADAIALHEATLKLLESSLGPDHPDTLSYRHNVATAYQAAGRTADAIALFEATLIARESKLGPDHPDTLSNRRALAATYIGVGRAPEAIAIYRTMAKSEESALGPDHPDTLTSRHNLATAYLAVGRTADAIALFEATLKAKESALGLEHPDTLRGRINLAGAYLEAGRADDAIGLYEPTVKLAESALGPDHPDTLTGRSNLARAYLSAGRTAEAAGLLEAALKARESTLGREHPNTIQNRANLATAYEFGGRWALAEPLRRDLLVWLRNKVPAGSPSLALALAQLGQNLLLQEHWSDAEAALRECLAIREETMPRSWLRYNSMSQLGGALLGQGRYAEAEPLVVEGYQGMNARVTTIAPQGRPRLTEAAGRVVRLYEAWGKPEKAAEWKPKVGLEDLPDDVFARP